MQDISFQIDYLALVVALLALLLSYFLWRREQQFSKPSLFFSSLDPSSTVRDWKTRWSSLPRLLNILAFLLFLVAFVDPHFFIPKKPTLTPGSENKNAMPTEGIAIYLLLDQSGSMAEQVTATINGNRVNITKEDLLRQVTKDFITGNPATGLEGRPNDLIGLVTFARVPQVQVPLTLDHKEILKELATVQVVKKNDQDGTAMGYAIFKTANMIAATKHYAAELAQKGKPAYDIKSSIIILVTDGLQDPSILDKDSKLRNMGLEEAAAYAKANGIRLYLINIDPNTYSEELAPQRHQMEKITQLTGGRLFIVNDPGDLSQIYATIDSLEKSVLPQEGLSKEKQPNFYRRISLYPYLIALGMLCMLTSILLQTLWLRKVP
jgi:Ca-activated chloride channel homolog